MCDFSSSENIKLKEHKQIEHKNARLPCTLGALNVYSCDLCEYSGPSLKVLENHKKFMHEGLRFPCNQCGYAASSNIELIKHKTIFHGTNR